MGLSERLSDLDRELSALGEAPTDLNERAGVQWARAASLAAIDEELETLSTGVTFVVATARRSSMLPPAPSSVADVSVVQALPDVSAVEASPFADAAFADAAFADAAFADAQLDAALGDAAPVEVATAADVMRAPSEAPQAMLHEPAFSDFPQPIVETLSASQAPQVSDFDTDEPFVPTLPSEPPPEVETTVGLGSKRRTLTMSEPPLSQMPPPPSFAPPGNDLDPFEGQPAPIPVPQRAPSVWPMAPAPKRTPTRSIRSAAPPPPPVPSSRPRSLSPELPMKRPSDTPDPFAPINRASSRPPTGLDADQLFGGISSTPPFGDAPPKMSAPPAPNLPKITTTATKTIQQTAPKPIVEAKQSDDDFELMVDDEMMEIDVEEMDELD